MIKPFVISDNNKRAKKIRFFLSKKIKFYSLTKSNLIIVVGGDGFMLEALKKNKNKKNPFME